MEELLNPVYRRVVRYQVHPMRDNFFADLSLIIPLSRWVHACATNDGRANAETANRHTIANAKESDIHLGFRTYQFL